jgi:hypothetical protein
MDTIGIAYDFFLVLSSTTAPGIFLTRPLVTNENGCEENQEAGERRWAFGKHLGAAS